MKSQSQGMNNEGMDSKLKLGDQLNKFRGIKEMEIYNLNSVIISHILRILASKDRF